MKLKLSLLDGESHSPTIRLQEKAVLRVSADSVTHHAEFLVTTHPSQYRRRCRHECLHY